MSLLYGWIHGWIRDRVVEGRKVDGDISEEDPTGGKAREHRCHFCILSKDEDGKETVRSVSKMTRMDYDTVLEWILWT